jgi:hypothetical protein
MLMGKIVKNLEKSTFLLECARAQTYWRLDN